MNSYVPLIAVAFLTLTPDSPSLGKNYELKSPNGEIRLVVDVADAVTWSLYNNDTPVLERSKLGLIIDGRQLPGSSPQPTSSQTTTIREHIQPVVPTKSSELEHHARQLTLDFDGTLAIQFRVFNSGVAYRFVSNMPGEISVGQEIAEFRFAEPCTTYFPEEERFVSHYERDYRRLALADISEDQMCSLPVLLKSESNNYVAISDADLFDYPAMFLTGTGGLAFKAAFPAAVKASQYNKQTRAVTGDESLTLKLAPGGGWAGIFTPR